MHKGLFDKEKKTKTVHYIFTTNEERTGKMEKPGKTTGAEVRNSSIHLRTSLPKFLINQTLGRSSLQSQGASKERAIDLHFAERYVSLSLQIRRRKSRVRTCPEMPPRRRPSWTVPPQKTLATCRGFDLRQRSSQAETRPRRKKKKLAAFRYFGHTSYFDTLLTF